MITWHGYDLCEKGFIINLSTRSDRKESASKQCDIAEIRGVDFFDAAIIKEEPYTKYGCTQSHLNLYKYQVDNNIEYMLILEDDIETIYGYNASDGYCITDINKQKKYVKNLISSLHTIKPDLLWLGTRIESNVDYYDDYISYSNKTLTSHAHICSYNLAKFALDNLHYKDSNQFLKNNLVTTVSNCLIFNQKSDYSDILNRDVDYRMWILGCHEEYCFKPIRDKINYYEYI